MSTKNILMSAAGVGGTTVATDPYFNNVALLLTGDEVDSTIRDHSASTPVKTVTAYGNATISTSVKKYGTGSMYFDGSGDAITVSAVDDCAFGTGDFTIECWINFISVATQQLIYDSRPASTNGLYPALYIGAGGTLYFFNNSTNVITGNTLLSNTWYHIAVSRNNSNTKMFVNGVQVGSTYSDSTNYLNGASRPMIGSSGYYTAGADSPVNGYIDDLRVTKGVARYISNFTPPTAALPTMVPSADPFWTNTVLLVNGEDATTIADHSYSNKTITNNNSVALNTSTVKYGSKSLYFNGTNSYLTLLADKDFDFSGGNFTVECWYKSNANVGNAMIVGWFPSNTAGAWALKAHGTGLRFTYNNGGFVDLDATGYTLNDNAWHHLAAVRNGTNLQIYADGISKGSWTITYSQVGSSTQPLSLGYQTQDNSYLQGYVDDLRVTKGVARYTTNFTPPNAALYTSPVTTYDPFWNNVQLLLTGNDIADHSNNLRALSVYGNTTISNSVKQYGTGSLSFDGSGDYIVGSTSNDYQVGTGDFTVECWLRQTNTPSNSMQIFDTRSSGMNGIILANGNARNIYAYAGNSGVVASVTINLNQWYHIAAVRSGGVLKIYIDGIERGSGASTDNVTGTNCYIAQSNDLYQATFGYIADFRFTKGIARYTTKFEPPTASLPNIDSTVTVAPDTDPFWYNTSLLLTGDDLLDHSSSPKTVTINGDTNAKTGTKKYGTGSIYFDGNGDYLSLASSTDFFFDTGNFTVDVWVNFSVVQDCAFFQTTNNISAANGPFWIGYSGGKLYVSQHGSVTYALGYTWTPSTGIWYHIATTRNAGTTTIYINGISVITSTMHNGLSFTQSGAAIGVLTTPSYFNGYIDDLRITKGVARYTTNFTPPAKSLPVIPTTYDPYWYNNSLLLTGDDLLDHSTNVKSIASNTAVTVNNSTFKYGTGSLSFNGTSSFLGFTTTSDLILSGGSFTIEAWIYPKSFAGYNTIISKRSGGATSAYQVNTDINTGYLSWYNGTAYTSTTAPTLNQWSHVAAVYDGTKINLYLNGVNVLSSTTTNTDYTTSDVKIGYDNVTSSAYFNGYIDDLRVTKGIARYTTTFTPPTSPAPIVEPTYDPYFNNTSLLLTGDDLLDHSYNLKDVMPHGTVSVDTSTKQRGTGSLKFDGVGDYLSVPSGTDFNLSSSSFTMEFWINTTSSTQYVTLISKQPSTYGTGMWALMINNASATTGDVSFYSYEVGSPVLTTSGVSIRDGGWHHIALVRNGSTWSIYVDGISRASASSTNTITDLSASVYIGGDQGYGRYFVGYIDDLRITKGVARYTSNFTPPSIALPASSGTTSLSTVATGSDSYFQNVSLLLTGDGYVDGQNNTFIDSSANNFAITRNGTPTQGAFSPYGNLWSNYFDSGNYLTVAYSAGGALDIQGTMTIEFWMYRPSSMGAYAQYEQSMGGVNTTNPTMFYLNNGIPSIYRGGNNESYGGEALTMDTWHHIAVVRNVSDTVTCYIDGIARPNTYTKSGSLWTSNLLIGRDYFGNGYWHGYMSNLRIVKGTALYTANFTPSTTPLTAITGTSLLTCQSNRFVDNSTNALAITVNGTPAVKRLSPFKPTTPYSVSTYGGSGYFNGSTDYLTLPSIALSTGDFTIECWVNRATISGSKVLAGSGSVGWIGWTNNTTFYVETTATNATFTIPDTTNSWAHYAIVRNSGVIRVFVNGAIATQSLTDSTGTLTISQINGQGASYLVNGYISDLRIVKSALYTTNFTPPIAPLPETANSTAASLLCSFTNASVIDNAMCNNLTSVGDVKINTSIKKYGGGSLYFDGTGDYLTLPANTDFNFGTGDFTIEGWMNMSSFASNSVLCDTRISSTSTTGVFIYFNTSGNAIAFINNTTAITSSSTYATNTWHHVALVRSGAINTLYVNGIPVGTYSFSTSLTDNWLTIGTVNSNRDTSTTYKMNGYIDDLRITKGVARYTDNFVPPITALQAL